MYCAQEVKRTHFKIPFFHNLSPCDLFLSFACNVHYVVKYNNVL